MKPSTIRVSLADAYTRCARARGMSGAQQLELWGFVYWRAPV